MERNESARSFAFAILACLSIFAAGAAHAEDAAPQTVEAAHALVSDADALAQKKDYTTATAKMRLVLASPVFSRLTAEDQYDTWWIVGIAEERAQNYRASQNLLKLACSSPAARVGAWIERLYVDKRLDDTDGVHVLTVIAANGSQYLRYINPRLVTWAAEKSVTMSDRDVIALIGPLHAAHWQDPEWDQGPDIMSVYLARAYLDGGDTKSAAAVVADITSVSALIGIRSEKLFDPVVALDPAHFDIAKANDAQIDKYRKRIQSEPDNLTAVLFLAAALIDGHRSKEALAIVDDALARVKAADKAHPAFKDTAASLNRVMEVRAKALFALGRTQDALDQMTVASGVAEYGEQNVSQLIDLADYQVAAGKPQDALKTLTQLNPQNTAAYGFMAAADARVCAYAMLHDSKNMQVQMDYMRAHKDDAPTLMLNAYLCAGDLDSAAAVTIQQMRDPLTRSRILVDLQDYSSAEIPSTQENGHSIQSLRNRPDVQAVIADLAHIATYPILAPDS